MMLTACPYISEQDTSTKNYKSIYIKKKFWADKLWSGTSRFDFERSAVTFAFSCRIQNSLTYLITS